MLSSSQLLSKLFPFLLLNLNVMCKKNKKKINVMCVEGKNKAYFQG